MKICPLCNTTYEDWIDFCFSDGMPLLAKGGVSSPLPVKPSSVGATIAPQPALGAELPTPSALAPIAPAAPPPAPVGRGAEVPERPAPPEPPSDITGVFTGPITDDDGEEFQRVPTRPMNLADLPTAAPTSLPVPEADSESDEQSRATVPLSSSALGSEELASEAATTLASASVPPAPVVETAVEAAPVSPPVEVVPPAPVVAARPAQDLEAAWHASPVAEPEPEPSPSKKGGMGIGLLVGGVAAAAVLLVVVVGGAALFMGGGKKAPEPAPAPVAVATPPPAPPPVAPPEPVLPPVDAVPVDPAAVDPTAVAAAAVPPVAATAPPVATPAPVAAPAVAAARPPPTTAPAAAVPVSKPPPASSPASASSATADADPWGAPVAVTSGVLKIVTDPDGATVYINEQQRGKTPVTVELAYGVHNIRVVRSGYKTEVRDVTIRVAELNVPFILKPEVVTGQVNVYGPAGYRVVIDGHDRGAMPVTVQVSEGVRQFKLVSDADSSGCTLPKEIAFRSPGRPETVTLACP